MIIFLKKNLPFTSESGISSLRRPVNMSFPINLSNSECLTRTLASSSAASGEIVLPSKRRTCSFSFLAISSHISLTFY